MGSTQSLQDKAYRALKEAVAEVVEQHRQAGRPLAVWKNGKVVLTVPRRTKRRT